MKQTNRTAFIFRIFAGGIVLTLLLAGTLLAMQSAEATQENSSLNESRLFLQDRWGVTGLTQRDATENEQAGNQH